MNNDKYNGRLFKPTVSQQEYIATRKAIAEEKARLEKQKETEALWQRYKEQDTNESFAAQEEVRESLRLQRLKDQLAMEVVITDIPQDL